MNPLDLLADAHNWFADKDFLWWPFSFLRPKAHERMTFNHTLQMTTAFGALTSVFFLVFMAMNGGLTLEAGALTALSCFMSFFLWFNAVTRPLWNRRANRKSK